MSAFEDPRERSRERDCLNSEQIMGISVGSRYPFLMTRQDGCILEYGEHGLTLFALFNNWKAIELQQFYTDKPVVFRWAELGGVGFLCAKFGDMPWCECPFHPAIYKQQGRKFAFPAIGEYAGLAVTVICADAETGEVLNIRLIGLGHDFSVAWQDWAVAAYEKDMTMEEYQNRVNTVFQHYTTEQIMQMGTLSYVLEGNR